MALCRLMPYRPKVHSEQNGNGSLATCSHAALTVNTRSPAAKPNMAAGMRKKGLHAARYCRYICNPMLPVARSSACETTRGALLADRREDSMTFAP